MAARPKIKFLLIYGKDSGTTEWNTIVRYSKAGRIYSAKVFIDFWDKKVSIPEQEPGFKALTGLEQAISKHSF